MDKEDVVYINMCKMEYYSAIKKNKILPFAKTWMDIKTVIQVKYVRKRKTNIV